MTTFRPTGAAAVLGLCIALGPSIAGFFIYRGIVEAKLGDRYVTAKGLVERVEKSDRGTWEIAFKVSGNDLASLYQKLSHDSDLVQKFILKEGFEKNEVAISSPRVTDLHAREYGSGDLSPERYLIEYSIFVNSPKVDILNTLSAKTGELLSQGISISRSETRFYLDRFNDLRPQLIADATKNAQEVASSFAKTTGSKIGGIREANQGVIRLTSPDASPNQEYDEGLNSLMKKIRVVVTLKFYLK
ncbi:MAG TPA: SIMPL domain-containing protein [Alphaproteobacteria bacterium]|nr:SIMPL domain-containing protein [Alphaproteobacteria bacterium]